MSRRQELDILFKDVEEKQLINPLLDEIIDLENRMSYLKTLPFIKVHPQNPELQKTTSAAKLYKECSQSYMNAIRILVNILRKVDEAERDSLVKKLEEFN